MSRTSCEYTLVEPQVSSSGSKEEIPGGSDTTEEMENPRLQPSTTYGGSNGYGKAEFHEKSTPRKILDSSKMYLAKKQNPLPLNASRLDRIKYSMLLPYEGSLAFCVTFLIIILMIWGSGASVSKAMLPGGHLFALGVVVTVGYIAGCAMELVNLPPLLGMLAVGIVLRNAPYIDVGNDLDSYWASKLRKIALTVILTRAGLNLDPVALKRLSLIVPRQAFVPSLCEAGIVTVVSHFLLDFPWIWSVLLGFVLSCASPAVVVPCMLTTQTKRLGIDKGVPTLVIAANSLDVVLAISAFSITLGIIFSTGNIGMQIAQVPISIIMGAAYGLILGVIAWYIPAKDHHYVAMQRVLMLLFGSLLAVLGSGAIGFSGAGALGCLTFAFTVAMGWRKAGHMESTGPVQQSFAILWKIFQPVLFGLIGTEINVRALEPELVGYAVGTLVAGLAIRVLISSLVTWGGGFNIKERIFIALSWLPKATVQAALGPVAIDYVRNNAEVRTPENLLYAQTILTIAVLSILIMAPLGALIILLSGPHLLKYTPTEEEEKKSKPEEL